VLNVAINVVELAGNVFQYADLETVLTFNAKRGMWFLGWTMILEISEFFSHGVHDPTKELNHSRRANGEVFILVAWVSDTVCPGNAGNAGMIAPFRFHAFLNLISPS
jgi:hypothetical protein